MKEKASEERYTGVREMVKYVLEEKFFSQQNQEPDFSKLTPADLKFMLAQWFFSQNRMGLGLATGLEALRDIHTPIFMAERNYEKETESYRINAEVEFIKKAFALAEEKDAIQKTEQPSQKRKTKEEKAKKHWNLHSYMWEPIWKPIKRFGISLPIV